MNEQLLTMALLIAAGTFSMLGGALDWDFFMNSHKAALFVRLFGRSGARAFYVLFGFALIGGGAAFAIDVLPKLPTPALQQARPALPPDGLG